MVQTGDVITMYAGNTGVYDATNKIGGGGGATSVVITRGNNNYLLLVAGGGGGNSGDIDIERQRATLTGLPHRPQGTMLL